MAHAFNPQLSAGERPTISAKANHNISQQKPTKMVILPPKVMDYLHKKVISPSQVAQCLLMLLSHTWSINRDTGVIEETGHPLDGQAIEDTILIYPKGLAQQLRHTF